MAANIIGLRELQLAMAGHKRDVQAKGAGQILFAGARIIRNGAKAEAKSLGLMRTGSLISNIALKRERNVPAGIFQYNLGVRSGRHMTRNKAAKFRLVVNQKGRIVSRRLDDPFYWRFLELDTKHRKGKPFLGKSLDVNQGRAIEAMQAAGKRFIDKVRR
jgi:HK97 gp10 family phage protein